jgi:hypothetical protein
MFPMGRPEVGMAKITISNADLVWIFTEKLKSFRDGAPAISIAIVPGKGGWSAIPSRNDRNHHPSLHHAYRACSERASRASRFGEGLIPAFKGVQRTNEGSPAWWKLKGPPTGGGPTLAVEGPAMIIH